MRLLCLITSSTSSHPIAVAGERCGDRQVLPHRARRHAKRKRATRSTISTTSTMPENPIRNSIIDTTTESVDDLCRFLLHFSSLNHEV